MTQQTFFDQPATRTATPTAPYIPTSETSREAAERIAPCTGRLQSLVFDFIRTRGQTGATDQELTEALGMLSDTARARRVELRDRRLIADSGRRFFDWVRRPDSRGRMGWQPVDSPEVVAFDDLDLPGPACPVCGSLESWLDALGRTRCGVCEAEILGKALQLSKRASQLPALARQRGPAPQDSRGCVPVESVDSQAPGTNRPARGGAGASGRAGQGGGRRLNGKQQQPRCTGRRGRENIPPAKPLR